jgi:hypothetical protein
MDLSPSRVPARTRVIKLPSKSNRLRQPKPRPDEEIDKSAPPALVRFAPFAVLAVALVLLGLSLSHLASGVAIVTGAGYSDGWAMAIGIDLGFIALELATLVAPADKRDAVTRYASPAIVGTLATSAAMNAFAFAAHADGLMIYPAIGLGLAIPALIYALVKVSAGLWIEN